jgi:hypothetical protein
MATKEELADILGALEEDDEWNNTSVGSSATQSTSVAHNLSTSSDDDGFCPKVTVFESGIFYSSFFLTLHCWQCAIEFFSLQMLPKQNHLKRTYWPSRNTLAIVNFALCNGRLSPLFLRYLPVKFYL